MSGLRNFRPGDVSRRQAILQASMALAAAVAAGKSLAGKTPDATPRAGLKVVVAGGHPGDPECGCAGTIARYTDLGHEVTLLYLNRGDQYCGAAPQQDCAGIRTAEAKKACEILKAQPLFAGQLDSKSVIDNQHYQEFERLLALQKPDVLFTQWPIDEHGDHRAVSALCLNAWLKTEKKFALYYYEVAGDTLLFSPTEYVDISSVESRRRAACYAHASQSPDKWYPAQTRITQFRGSQIGVAQAEGFLRHPGANRAVLPA